MHVTRAVLPILRAQKSGHILNVSSIAELAPYNVHVTLIEPGAFRTAFAGGAILEAENKMAAYEGVISPVREWLKSVDGKQPGDPKKAAKAMIDITETENPPLRLLLGGDALAMARQKVAGLTANFDAYDAVTVDTAYPGMTAGAIGG